MDYGIHESSASRTILKVEDVIINSEKFELPKKLSHGNLNNTDWTAITINATKTPIERLKKPETVLLTLHWNIQTTTAIVQHKIGLLKLFKIVATKYHNRRMRYDLRMKLFTGIADSEIDL